MEDVSVSEYQYSHPALGRRAKYTDNSSHPDLDEDEASNAPGHKSIRQRPFGNWPRCASCCIGVYIPLNILVFVSLLFGLLFGKLEMAAEVTANDAKVRHQYGNQQIAGHVEEVLQKLPALCLALFEQHGGEEGIDGYALRSILEDAMTNMNNNTLEPYLLLEETTKDQVVVPRNKSLQDLATYLAKCGEQGALVRDNWLDLFNNNQTGEDGNDLTFNYIRCVNRTNPLNFNFIMTPTNQDILESRPASQAILYEESWINSQQELEEAYRTEGLYSELEVLQKSYEEATGQEKCAVNMPSAGE